MDIIQQLADELALWKPQRQGLLKLHSTLVAIPDLRASPDEVAANLPGALRFDTQFPSLCFAIATGCGKTRLMGACIAYLYQTRGYRNFFTLAPGETIYKKLISDFTPYHPRYVLRGYTDLPEFALVTGENYDRTSIVNRLIADELAIYIFNIQKIFNPREDVTFKFHQFRETLGSSFADILRSKEDLVILMDESHRYRGPASLAAMNDLRPLLGLEFTATPSFRDNIIYPYSLGQAIEDGLVKTPVVLGRRGQRAYRGEIEDIKLRDGIDRHRRKKALLEEHCYNNDLPQVVPLVLISSADIPHADNLKRRLESTDFFNGEYIGKVIRTHSRLGANDADIERLIQLESPDNAVEIVIHVNKLKEGWDVKNVYTIIPLRASVSEILTEQTIGRGLRLPFRKRTGNDELDTLEIVAHEHYADIVQRAAEYQRQYGSPIKTSAIEDQQSGDSEPRLIVPQEDSPYKITIPSLRPRQHVQAELEAFSIKPTRDFGPVQITLVETQLGQGPEQAKVIGIAPMHQDEDPVRYLTRILLTDAPMLKSSDPEHRRIVAELAHAYLRGVTSDPEQWRDRVNAHAQDMYKDILAQLEQHFRADTKREFEPQDGQIPLRPWKKTVPKGYQPSHKNTVPDGECVGEVITGYERTVFSESVFDSTPEKWFADILDEDREVQKWLRVPPRQMPIFYTSGDYNPDFVVETASHYYLIEIKREDEVHPSLLPQVRAKANAALLWCQRARQVSDKEWQYKLIRDTAVEKGQSFSAIIARAERL